MTDTLLVEGGFDKHVTDLTKLVIHYRTELNNQLEHRDFERAKGTAETLQSILEILTRLHSIENDWKQLHGQPSFAEIPVKIPGKRGRKPKERHGEPEPAALEYTETGEPVKKHRGRKPGSKNKPKFGVEPKEKKEPGVRGRRRRGSEGPHLQQYDYYRPILEALQANGGSMDSNHCRDVVRSKLAPKFQDGDREIVGNSDTERWAYLIPWARIKLVKTGLMKKDSPRKLWEISNLGLDWLDGKWGNDPIQIDKMELPWLLPDDDKPKPHFIPGRKPIFHTESETPTEPAPEPPTE